MAVFRFEYCALMYPKYTNNLEYVMYPKFLEYERIFFINLRFGGYSI